MPVDPHALLTSVTSELARVTDRRVRAHITALLIEPALSMRQWDYGDVGAQLPCWMVLAHEPSNTGVAFCDLGFGPHRPWGLLTLTGTPAAMSMGMDSAWFPSFLDAYRDSFAITELPIWRVFQSLQGASDAVAITEEGTWETTWAQVMSLRESDPDNSYDCEASVFDG